jgi:RNA polymerase sigma-70 factor (ECF subfamily)
MPMMHFRILLLMPGDLSGISEARVRYTPGFTLLPRMINKRKKNATVSLDEVGDFFASSHEGNTWFDGDEAQLKLQNAILKLPEKQRIVFNLKYFEELTYEEMSKVLKTSEGALKASYHHAVKKIEKMLEGD